MGEKNAEDPPQPPSFTMARTAFLCLVVALLALFSSTTAGWNTKKCAKKLSKADKKWDNQITKMVDKGCDPVPSVPGYPIPGDELLGSISDGNVPLHNYAKVVMQNVANDAATLTAMATGCDNANTDADAAIVDLGTVGTESDGAITDLGTVDSEIVLAVADGVTAADTDFAAAAAGDQTACRAKCAEAKVHVDAAFVHIAAAKAAGLLADTHVDNAKAAGILADAHVDDAKTDITAVKANVVIVQKTDNYPARSGTVPSGGEFHYELGCVCTGAKIGTLGRISTKVQNVNVMDAGAAQTDFVFNTQSKCATTLTDEKGICSSKALEACTKAATDNFNVAGGQTVKVEILGC